MKNELHKRIWSALLVLLMVMECLPIGAVRAELTEEPTLETAVIEASAETGDVTETTEAAPETTEATVAPETTEATAATEITEATAAAEAEPVTEVADLCPYCEETVDENGAVIHGQGCNAQYAYDGTADVGKYVRLTPEAAEYGVFVSGTHSTEDALIFYYEEFGADTVMRITDWYWSPVNTDLWYQVELYSGAFPESTEDYTWPDPAWILQDYTNASYEYDAALEFYTPEIPENPDSSCPVCGKEDCTAIHFWCDYCNAYDCGKAHLICRACGDVDCEKDHIFCGYCNDYDCGNSHDYKPATTPVIPENPALTGGTDVSIVDECGDAVTGEFILFEGTKSSLSAWTELEGEVSYQWQICVDGQWINIQGQTDKGILVSPAMFLSLTSATIRCAVTSGGQTLTSDGISVVITEQPEQASFALASNMAALAAEDNSGDLKKAYVVVQYVYADGRTASTADFAEIVPGNAYSHSYTLPTIPGYKATLNTHSYGNSADLSGDTLVMNFAENVLTEEYTIFTVTYVPDYVSYTVIHYWQNVDNDNYTEHARETIATKYKTGDMIADAHKSYPGFYNLLYETPAAAADGSTVIEVYYDRYYYLMTFNLGDMGYGVDPIYARYGDAIEIGTPTRAGYTFQGWTLNGVEATVPSTMPAENREYVAQWKVVDTAKVSVVIWGENPDDEGYSYREKESFIMEAVPGETISWDTLKYSCGQVAHRHSAECGYNCGQVGHTHSIENGCYKLTCTQESHNHDNCTLDCIHPECTLDCYSTAGNWKEESIPDDENPEDQGNGIWTYKTGFIFFQTTHYYVKVGDKWYCSDEGNEEKITYDCIHPSHTDACYTCGKVATTHNHTLANCYELNCARAIHVHDATCGYACGKTEHTHVSGCEVDTNIMDATRWTYEKSDTVTVEADGSTVMNVYYKRAQYSVKFYSNSSHTKEYTDYRITAKWGANILNKWPKHNGSSSWYVEKKTNTWQNSIQVMPVGGANFWGPKTGSSSYTAYYYVEALPGDADTFEHNNVIYKFHHSDISSSSGNVTEEEKYGIEGFTYKEGTSNGQSFNNAKFYYTRNSYSLVFNDGYNDVKTESVKYEAPLSTYADYRPTLPSAYEAGSRNFVGWYLNPECTGEEYVLSGHKMPASDVKLYAKWEPVSYTVNYYLTRDSLTRGENIPTEMARLVNEAIAAGEITEKPAVDPYTTVFAEKTVQHGTHIGNPGDPEVTEGYETIHPRAGYDFIGWFYLNDDGEETAFDPVNMPVHQDLDLYAKWSANVLCYYNVYFALDENEDGKADVGTDGKILYVADPISGSAIAGRTYTFTAKGGEELDDPDGEVNYQEGYFPTVGSHSIVIDIQDEAGTGANSYTFLYRPKAAVPYTVRYVNKDTGEALFADKVVNDNKNVVVTENFLYKQGYMPDAYQKTLVVTDDGDGSNDVIIFYYTADIEHALYVVNYYIQDLNDDLTHEGWSKYTSLQSQGDIGTDYSADAIAIDGFTLSQSYTDDYNVTQKKNGMDGTNLPATVGVLTGETLTGTLTDKGLELNFYYTRNLYPYEFRYMLNGTTTKLADTEFGKAGYDTVVSMGAKEIVKDLDGDGVYEDYRLYDPTETTKDIHIIKDGDPLKFDAQVTEGQATVNVATFYYVRCTQTMTIKKEVVDRSTVDDPDPNREYTIRLLIHATSGYHMSSYAYTKTGGETGTLSPVPSAPNTLQFTLRDGETITIGGLPTAEYTVSELDIPTGYYDTYSPAQKNKLTVDGQLDVTVTNTYDPADLEISKTVVEVETGNLPEVQDFLFKVVYTGEETLPGSYTYTVSGTKDGQETRTVDVAGKQFNFTLKKGETAYFHNLPTGAYTVEEEDYAARGYKTSYTLGTGGEQTTGRTANAELEPGEVTQVHFTNEFPVGDLQIQKTVAKEFYGTAWDGDTFWFTVSRVDRDLTPGYKYKVSLGEDYPDIEAVVGKDKKLKISIPFDSDDAEALETAGASIAHTLTIENLPVGTYVVNEAEYSDYVQSDRDIEALTVPNNPVAEFTNTLKLPKGSLYLAKELVPAEGYDGNLDKDKVFTFTIKAVTAVPASATVDVSANGGEPEARAMGAEGLTVTVKANQNVIISNLPVGTYQIIEATEPQYANKFAWAERPAGPWAPLDSSSIDGCLYTEVTVEKAETTHVLCTNVYPVNTAKLILHKKITNRQPQDLVPGDSFTFTVTLDKLTKDQITYQIFDESGTKVGADRTADVTDGSFTLSLTDGQYAVIAYLPVSSCTVTETGNDAYDTSYRVYLYGVDVPVSMPPDTTDMKTEASENETSVTRELAAGTTELMIFENQRKINITYNSNYPAALSQDNVSASTEKAYGVDYSIETYSDKDKIIVDTEFAAEGYVIDSWNTKSDGSGTKYEPGAIYTDNQDLTLYAQWIDERIADDVKVYVGINMSYYMTENQDYYYTLPDEPDIVDLRGIRIHNKKVEDGTYHWAIDLSDWNDWLDGVPSDFINPDIMNPGVLQRNPTDPTKDVVGVFDPNGIKTKALLYFTEADYSGENGIIEAWIDVRDEMKKQYPSNINWDKLSTDAEDFEVIPYVIKYHRRNKVQEYAWFIDMVIVPKARFKVNYEINLKEGYTATIPEDNTEYGENYFVNVKSTDSTATNQNDSRYVARFKEWILTDTDGKPVKDAEGNVITIDTERNRFPMPAYNVKLTAQWIYPVEYTVNHYKWDPVAGEYVLQTEKTEHNVGHIGDPAEYTAQNYTGYYLKEVVPADLRITEDDQVFNVYYYPNTLTITQTGVEENESRIYRVAGGTVDMYVEIQGNKSVTIEQIPLGDYTVTELTDWTWKYDSDAESTASQKSVTVTPGGPNQVNFAFTTNNPDWLGGENARNNKFASTPVLQP